MISLLNVGASYDAIAASKGLGFAEIDFTGVTSIVFRVRCNKVGTGTISWQLWNETDAAEIGVINDAAAGDNKNLSVTISSGIPTGVKQVRVRCKSTVAGDDPVFYGSSIRLVRT
jgi:hypothetical protein